MTSRTTSSARVACPRRCEKEDCFLHQEQWEPIAGRIVTCNYTKCNNCGYEKSELVVPGNFSIQRIPRM